MDHRKPTKPSKYRRAIADRISKGLTPVVTSKAWLPDNFVTSSKFKEVKEKSDWLGIWDPSFTEVNLEQNDRKVTVRTRVFKFHQRKPVVRVYAPPAPKGLGQEQLEYILNALQHSTEVSIQQRLDANRLRLGISPKRHEESLKNMWLEVGALKERDKIKERYVLLRKNDTTLTCSSCALKINS